MSACKAKEGEICLGKSRDELENDTRRNKQVKKSPKNRGNTVVELTRAALFAAAFCMLAPHTVYLPMSPVGVSLGTFLLYLTGMLLGTRTGCISVFLYLCMGFLGLPVFSGYTAGAGALFGPTGGFLIGYLPCVLLVSIVMAKGTVLKKGWVRFAVGMLLGTVALYLCGTVWFSFVYGEGVTFGKAITLCVLPFLPFDGVKIILATVLYQPLLRLKRYA